jgi:hypothetical protein
MDIQRLAHDGKRLASAISGSGSFDISCTQLMEVHPPRDAETFKMVCHGAMVDTEFPSEVMQ